jgi:hypothetical protein
MTSLELTTQIISVLENFDGLDKTETKELINLLHEIKKIPVVIEQIQLELAKRVKSKEVSKYIELDDQLYSLETNTFYTVFTVDHANSEELIKLQKEIIDCENKLDDYIDLETQQIEELVIKKYTLLDQLATEAKKQKAIDTDKLILVNKENNFYEILKENK